MKYIKLYEAILSTDEVKDKFTPYINWEMIEDIKDMSLEYLDNNLILDIEIFYDITPKDWSTVHELTIYSMEYSHDIKSCSVDWHLIYEVVGEVIRGNIVYKVFLFKKVYQWQPNNTSVAKNETNELISRLEEAYPNINIE